MAHFSLQKNEQQIKRITPHWAILTPCGSMLVFIGLFLILGTQSMFGLLYTLFQPVYLYFVSLFSVFFILIGIRQTWLWHTSYYILTTQRLIACQGFLLKQHQSIKLSGIESVRVRQGITGRYLNYGDMMVKSLGNSLLLLTYIPEPMNLHDQIMSQP
jgi:uncharacterized membrane protein YdbT with pleckstrin-like domain